MPAKKEQYPILVIIGPSGAGKSTVVNHLASEGLVFVNPTWTTRPPRPEELVVSLEHRFVSEKVFALKEKAGYFLETVQMFDLPYKYGLPELKPSKPDCISLIMLRAPLVERVYKYYTNFIVYQIEDSMQAIRRRLEDRQKKR